MIPSDVFLGVRQQGHMVVLLLVFGGTSAQIHSDCAGSHSCEQCVRVPST